MIKYILKRLLSMIPLLFFISALVFLLMYLAPGDFLSQARNSKDISPEIVRQQEISLGLDKPWYVQYGRWLNSVSPIKTSLLLPEGESSEKPLVYFGAPDFGYSWSYKISVSQLLSQRIVSTLILALFTTVLTYLIAIPLGVLAAVYKGSIFDRLSTFLAYAAVSMPSFFLALLAVLFAAVSGIFPTGGQTSIMYDFLPIHAKFADYMWHLVLPVLVLSVGGVASVMRVMRASFLEYMASQFAVTARAKGLSERAVMFKHVLRNAINPIVTSFGFSFAGLLSGALLVENVMNYPGLGQLIYTAIIRQDQYVVMAGVVMGCVMLVLGQLLADILLALTDPRIRLENERVPYKWVGLILAFAFAMVVGLTAISELWQEGFEFIKMLALWGTKIFIAIVLISLFAALVAAAVYFCKNFLPKLMRSFRGACAFFTLLILYILAALAPFIAPYEAATPCLQKPFHPPTKIFFKDWRLHCQIYENLDPSASKYEAVEGASFPIKFFAKKKSAGGQKILGLIPCNYSLFAADTSDENARIYLLGSDATGRDVFSRLLYGAQISLSIGLIGIAITMVIGFVVGGLAGYFGGAFDFVAMRICEFLMAIPGLYLLLAMRSAFADYFESSQMYLMIVIILSLIGWAGAARVIRGMSLSLAKRQFVQAAEGMGQKPLKIIFKHFLPNVMGFLIVSATLSIPAYILGEASLSFLGLGIQEPSASWGLMLAQAQQDSKILMLGFWWMLLPGLAILIAVLAFNILGDVLND